jgi:hypothetical protein
MTDTGEREGTVRSALPLAALLLVGVAGTGTLHYFLTAAGHATLGSATFALGYGGTALAVWYGWVRHIDFEGGGA